MYVDDLTLEYNRNGCGTISSIDRQLVNRTCECNLNVKWWRSSSIDARFAQDPGKYPRLACLIGGSCLGPHNQHQYMLTNENDVRQEPRLRLCVLPGRFCVPYISRNVSPNDDNPQNLNVQIRGLTEMLGFAASALSLRLK